MMSDKNSNQKKPVIMVIGQFPPPVHGFSFITLQMSNLLSHKYIVVRHNLVPQSEFFRRPVLYNLVRLFLTVKAALAILKSRRNTAVYIACEGGIGLIYTNILAIATRFKKSPVTLHHHSFHYIDNSLTLIRILVKILPKRTTHFFLCNLMAQRFQDQYGNVKSKVISNSAFVTLPKQTNLKRAVIKPFTIGHLSNLNKEKGLRLFLQTIEACANKGLSFKAILAGPPVSDSDRQVIEDAQQKFGAQLDYRGAVYDDEKMKFYKDIDLFLFPTRYFNEAQPTVIAEAMACGIPVLSYNRGCISDQIGLCGAVFEQDMDFVSHAVEKIEGYIENLNDFKILKKQTVEAFETDRAQALKTIESLMDG
jgi:glycosyltransferase involved in cell wall biosynthesis